MTTLRNAAVFLKECGGRFETTGSLFPSSRFLGRAITRPLLTRPASPIRVLECGPGTGAFTELIVPHLRPGDVLDLVELNPSFVAILKERIRSDRRWRTAVPHTAIHSLPLQEFFPAERYDFIVSGLPHINFPASILAEIVECYHRLLKPGGRLSYFEYMYIRPMRRVATLGLDGPRIDQVDRLMNGLLAQYKASREEILLNFPPAWVRHLIRNASGGLADAVPPTRSAQGTVTYQPAGH